jgi:hypothetical protein
LESLRACVGFDDDVVAAAKLLQTGQRSDPVLAAVDMTAEDGIRGWRSGLGPYAYQPISEGRSGIAIAPLSSTVTAVIGIFRSRRGMASIFG